MAPKSHSHPLGKFGRSRGWTQIEIAEHFGIPYSTTKMILSGHSRMSWRRAVQVSKRSRGQITPYGIMQWQDRHVPIEAA